MKIAILLFVGALALGPAAAAARGDAQAQFDLGAAYQSGDGAPKDLAAAAHWLRKAADQGHEQAQISLGLMHLTGQGMARDRVEALKWFSIAAVHGPRGNAEAIRRRDRLAATLTRRQRAQAQRRMDDWGAN